MFMSSLGLITDTPVLLPMTSMRMVQSGFVRLTFRLMSFATASIIWRLRSSVLLFSMVTRKTSFCPILLESCWTASTICWISVWTTLSTGMMRMMCLKTSGRVFRSSLSDSIAWRGSRLVLAMISPWARLLSTRGLGSPMSLRSIQSSAVPLLSSLRGVEAMRLKSATILVVLRVFLIYIGVYGYVHEAAR